MPVRLAHPVSHHARQMPDAIATSCDGRRRTWREFRERVARLAGGLIANRVGPGDRVAILAGNADHYYECMVATWWAGGAINPVNIRWSAAEIAYSLDDCDTRILIVDQIYAHLIPELRAASRTLRVVVEIGGTGTNDHLEYEALIARHDPVPDREHGGEDLAGVFYTGGTTGFPKGVALTHASIASNTLFNLMEMPLTSDDVVLAVAPMFHLAGMCVVIRAMFRGATCAFVTGFDEQSFLAVAEREGATFTLLVPVMIQRLLDSGADLAHALRALRLIQYGASPIGETVLRRVIAQLPHVSLVQGYGMTETSGPYTVLPAAVHRDLDGAGAARLRSAGRAVTGMELRIVDDGGATLPPGQVGEIICRGAIVMREYWNQRAMSATAMRDGWMHSGDMGYLDDDGYLFIVDRLKDMIVSGGENVYSAEVENALAKHASIAACAVIGIPSERWGEQVHAVVVTKPGTATTPEALRAHCKALIAGYKCPVSVEFRDELPYTGAGKLQKNVLREPYWESRERRVG